VSIDPTSPEPDIGLAEDTSDTFFERPSPIVCIVWLISRMVFWIMLAMGLTLAHNLGYLNNEWWQSWVFSPSFAWLIPPVHIVLPLLSYKGWGYQLRQHDLLVRRGFVTREYVSVPLARVQQVDVSSSPLERLLGLTKLVVHTAGTRAARTQIPGLPGERAAALRDELSRKGDELAE